jgi:hypothetical protein
MVYLFEGLLKKVKSVRQGKELFKLKIPFFIGRNNDYNNLISSSERPV